jgi:cell fate (sporulation/competence/biofilm development) regulator YlbF (YheA/YmcA/DUF963 family)
MSIFFFFFAGELSHTEKKQFGLHVTTSSLKKKNMDELLTEDQLSKALGKLNNSEFWEKNIDLLLRLFNTLKLQTKINPGLREHNQDDLDWTNLGELNKQLQEKEKIRAEIRKVSDLSRFRKLRPSTNPSVLNAQNCKEMFDHYNALQQKIAEVSGVKYENLKNRTFKVSEN